MSGSPVSMVDVGANPRGSAGQSEWFHHAGPVVMSENHEIDITRRPRLTCFPTITPSHVHEPIAIRRRLPPHLLHLPHGNG